MSKTNITNFTKKVVAGCLALAMIVTGLVLIPKTAKAAEDIVKDEIVYTPMEMATYWSAEKKMAPVKADHIFAGWYTADESQNVTAIQEEDGVPEGTTTYAKFVPSYVLSVKTQVEKKAEVASTDTKPESTFLRVLSSVDSGDYKNVGFEILLGDKETVLNVEPITKVYAGLKLSAEDTEAKYPNVVFGDAAQYFIALDMKNIKSGSFSSKIYVRPYWTTLDGTKVEGLAKNVRVEDKYTDHKYLSVPVNLLTDGANPIKMAAGMVEITYNSEKFEVATVDNDVKIDTGRLLPEMKYAITEGKIKCVGNAVTTGTDVTADGLYANVRFQRKEGYENATEADLNLEIKAKKFCDWAEELKDVIAW